MTGKVVQSFCSYNSGSSRPHSPQLFPDLDTRAAGSGGVDSARMQLLASSAWLPSCSNSPGWAWAVDEEPNVPIGCHWGATWLNKLLRFICRLKRVTNKSHSVGSTKLWSCWNLKKKNLLCILQTEGNVWGSIPLSETLECYPFPWFLCLADPRASGWGWQLEIRGQTGEQSWMGVTLRHCESHKLLFGKWFKAVWWILG